MADPFTQTTGKEVLDELTLGACCDDFCMDCILEISCQIESNCPDDCGGPHGNPIKNTCDGHGCIVDGVQDCPGCGCIPPWTEAKKRDCWSCGPNQLKKSYWEEAQCACPGIACPDGSMENCCSDGEACCELANYDWEQTFCNGGVSCEEQKRLSRLAMQCWWRKYTRNGACQCGSCTGGRTNCECQGTDWMGPGCCSDPNCIAHGGSMTCSELLRMHNGGPCSWDDSWTEDYIVKGCTWACANSPECANCLDCDCGDDGGPIVEIGKKTVVKSMNPPVGGACCLDGLCYDGYTEIFCRNDGGMYHGDETLCKDYPECENDNTDCSSDAQCPIGLCCENGLCVPCARVGGRAWR